LLKRQNSAIVAANTNHSKTISADATAPRRQSKKSQVQSALSPNWAMKKPSAMRAPAKPRTRHTSHAATPIIRYSSVHTGPNSQAGGAQAGRTSCA